MALNLSGFKKWYESIGVNSGVASLLALILGAVGIKITGAQITELQVLIPGVISSAGLIFKRVRQETKGMDLKAWIYAAIGVLTGSVTAFGIDPETSRTLAEQITGIATIIFTILSSYGIHRATKKIEK